MRLISFLLCLISINFCLSQQEELNKNKSEKLLNNFSSFKSGEKLEYRLSYGLFNASYASLTLRDEVLDGKKSIKSDICG